RPDYLGQFLEHDLAPIVFERGTMRGNLLHTPFVEDLRVRNPMLEGCFSRISVLVEADDRVAAASDALEFLRSGGGDTFLWKLRAQSRFHPAELPNLLEQTPGARGEFGGEAFNKPRTPGWIDHVVQVAFFLQNKLRVPGHASAEIVGRAN